PILRARPAAELVGGSDAGLVAPHSLEPRGGRADLPFARAPGFSPPEKAAGVGSHRPTGPRLRPTSAPPAAAPCLSWSRSRDLADSPSQWTDHPYRRVTRRRKSVAPPILYPVFGTCLPVGLTPWCRPRRRNSHDVSVERTGRAPEFGIETFGQRAFGVDGRRAKRVVDRLHVRAVSSRSCAGTLGPPQ